MKPSQKNHKEHQWYRRNTLYGGLLMCSSPCEMIMPKKNCPDWSRYSKEGGFWGLKKSCVLCWVSHLSTTDYVYCIVIWVLGWGAFTKTSTWLEALNCNTMLSVFFRFRPVFKLKHKKKKNDDSALRYPGTTLLQVILLRIDGTKKIC